MSCLRSHWAHEGLAESVIDPRTLQGLTQTEKLWQCDRSCVVYFKDECSLRHYPTAWPANYFPYVLPGVNTFWNTSLCDKRDRKDMPLPESKELHNCTVDVNTHVCIAQPHIMCQHNKTTLNPTSFQPHSVCCDKTWQCSSDIMTVLVHKPVKAVL